MKKWMSVGWTLIIVMQMLLVLIPLVASLAPVIKDSLEMELHAQVCISFLLLFFTSKASLSKLQLS